MSLFRCSQCNAVENTATCDHWRRKSEGLPLLCSECDPEIGRWHGLFPKRDADKGGYHEDARGYLVKATPPAAPGPGR